MAAASLPYHEPGIERIMILASFLLALNIINSVLDRALYCGLVGQVLIGVAWGTPGGKWLSSSLEDSIVQLGYLGLIMIVRAGGLSTSIATMKANLLLSVCVAITGIAAPMALSFFLAPMVGASYIQCFAAGAALCSTSLGTTFTVLSTSGLVATRLGSVLSTAAMMDDVVGLVMVQIVSSLGKGNTEISPVTVIRPILVSLAFAVLVPLACRFLLNPFMSAVGRLRGQHGDTRAARISKTKQTVVAIQTALLLTLVVSASYAGASVLLAAYLAGIVGAWWDDKALKEITAAEASSSTSNRSSESNATQTEAEPSVVNQKYGGQVSSKENSQPVAGSTRTSTSETYERYYVQPIERILKPFFFASVGFSIPISKMFSGPVVWRGIIYTILMLVGKALCGIWLVKFSPLLRDTMGNFFSSMTTEIQTALHRLPLGRLVHQPKKGQERVSGSNSRPQDQGQPLRQTQSSSTSPAPAGKASRTPAKPLSLYPAGIMSFAMIARGEIGFLISSVAESNGIFLGSSASASASSDEASEIFLIITWAIVLCTVIGPFCVGLLVRRVKKLEAGSAATQVEGSSKNVLGVWGVS
ncbi:putative Sodium/hydrogen exchanger family-domain-containing protein [Seiridium unicorne]|uniref:Sodium/hydrogen exchanger family-domain-containing protein n=1 Tax=Seiridium unicorne TaxID=138068 RepID=A0ABR2UG69_9PEZI